MSLVNSIDFKDSTNLNPFGGLRASLDGQRFDSEFSHDLQYELFDRIVQTGSSIYYDVNARDAILQIGVSTIGQRVDLVQHWYNPYTPGNGQKIALTGNFNNSNIQGISVYLFHKNGISNSTTLYGVSSWISGASGFAGNGISWSNSQIFEMDFQSLRVGRIRFALNRNGVENPILTISNDNRRQTGYWQYPNLPVHYKLSNGASNTIAEAGYFDENNGIGLRIDMPISANASLRATCTTVKSDGGMDLQDMVGFERSVSNRTTTRVVGASFLPLISIRVKDLFNGVTNNSIVLPTDILLKTNNPIYYQVIYNPILAGASWQNVGTTTSCVEYDVLATGYTNGTVVSEGYAVTAGVNQRSLNTGLLERVVLSRGYSGNNDILSIIPIRDSTSNSDVAGVIGWKEIR